MHTWYGISCQSGSIGQTVVHKMWSVFAFPVRVVVEGKQLFTHTDMCSHFLSCATDSMYFGKVLYSIADTYAIALV